MICGRGDRGPDGTDGRELAVGSECNEGGVKVAFDEMLGVLGLADVIAVSVVARLDREADRLRDVLNVARTPDVS